MGIFAKDLTSAHRHSIDECDRRLRALPSYDQFHCLPERFECSCGRVWIHVCDEAEGCFYCQEEDE